MSIGYRWKYISLEKAREMGGKIRLAHAKRRARENDPMGTPLVEMLREYTRRYDEAAWEDNWHEMQYFERQITDLKHRIRLGETHDMPF